MTGLDTNILVRVFANDDPQQSPKAKYFLSSLTPSDPGWIGHGTLIELVWVLSTKNQVRRDEIARILDHLLVEDTLVIDQTEIVEEALQNYRSGRADFADCLIAASAKAAGCARTVTFDRIAARDAGMELVQ